MNRELWMALCTGLVACAPAEESASAVPGATYERDETGALFGRMDAEALAGWLTDRGLVAPEPALGLVEGGSCEAFVQALAEAETPADLGRVGLFLQAYQRPDAARACFEAARQPGPAGARWVHHLGDLAEESGDLEGALALFREASALDPTAVAPRARAAWLLRDAGQLDEALELLEVVRESQPRHLLALTLLVERALDAGDVGSAAVPITQALQTYPDQRQVLLLAARYNELRGKTVQAEMFRESARDAAELGVLTIDPWRAQLEADTRSLLHARAACQELLERGRWAELAAVSEDLDHRAPSAVWKGRGAQALLQLGRPAEARALAERATNDHPDAPHGYEVLALLALGEQRFEEAEALGLQALSRDDGSRLGAEVLVKSLLARGRGDEAVARLGTFVQRYPDDPRAVTLELLTRFELAGAGLRAKDPAEARRHLEEARLAVDRGERLQPGAERWTAARSDLARLERALFALETS